MAGVPPGKTKGSTMNAETPINCGSDEAHALSQFLADWARLRREQLKLDSPFASEMKIELDRTINAMVREGYAR